MIRVLNAENKLSFVDDSLPHVDKNSPNYTQWNQTIDMVLPHTQFGSLIEILFPSKESAPIFCWKSSLSNVYFIPQF